LDILHKESIIPELRAQNKKEVLEELTTALLRHKQSLDKDALVEVLLEREKLGSTGIGDHLFFLLVAPENSAGVHLRALAKISRLLKSAHFRKRLMDASTTEEIFHIIQEEDKEF